MPNGGFSGRNLQGIVRVLQAFGNTGCFSYLLTEQYNIIGQIYVNDFSFQNSVCVYDDKIFFVHVVYRNDSDSLEGSFYIYYVDIGQTIPSYINAVNIGDPYDPPFNEPPIFPPILEVINRYSLAAMVAVDNTGFYVYSHQDTPTKTYIQLSSYEYDWTPKANTGATNYDATSGDIQRLPRSMSAYNGNLYTISNDGYVYIYDFVSMTEQGSWIVSGGTTAKNHSISVWDDKVYVMRSITSTGAKVFIYELDGTFVDDFEVLLHNIYGGTSKYQHNSMIVNSNVIYTTGSGYHQQFTIDGTFICSSQMTYQNNLIGMISWKNNSNIYLTNGKVITP